jgi:glycine/D-amino acid oxidase-like deaminating enzyme
LASRHVGCIHDRSVPRRPRLRPSDVEPLAIELYLEYAAWFQRKAGVRVEPAEVVRLDIASDGRFDAALDHGTVRAHKVVIAIGLRYFAEVPQELQTTFPSGRLEHSCNFARQQGQGGTVSHYRRSAERIRVGGSAA